MSSATDSRSATRPAAHWSKTLPPGNGRSVYARIWLIPGTVTAAVLTGGLLRWWLR